MMKHIHELLEQETNAEDDSTEATLDTLPPVESPSSEEVQQKDGTVIENHTDGASSFPDDGAASVPRPTTVRKPKTTSRQARLPTRIQPARRTGRPDRYLALLLPYTICVLALLRPVTIDALLVQHMVIFNEKPGVAFGESFWTVIQRILTNLRQTFVFISFKVTDKGLS
jgi:hypothetical protein